MLKNPCKATRFLFNTHECTFNDKSNMQEGWPAKLKRYEVLLAGLFQHISSQNELLMRA